MNKYLIMALCLTAISICFSCQTKKSPEDSSIKNLQQSIIKFSSVANTIDDDMESLWAFSTADSIAKTMELKDESLWRDLARAYSALSYIGYGMSYTRSARSGDVNKLFYLSSIIVKCDPDTIMPNRYLHLIELNSDKSFVNFYDVSNMKRTDDMNNSYEKSLSLMDSIYSRKSDRIIINNEEIPNDFLQFQKLNDCFLIVYASMLIDLFNNNSKSDIEYQNKCMRLDKIALGMDSLPSELRSMVSKQINIRAKLIDMLAEEIKAIE